MKNSSPELQDPGVAARSCALGVVDMDRPTATAALWSRRSTGQSGVAHAVALTGVDPRVVSAAATMSLIASPEAAALLNDMDRLTRCMTTTVETTSERCVLSVRGPVQWSETVTARANALGNEDIYVCATAGRSFNTVENRALVAAIAEIARGAAALRSDMAEELEHLPGELIAQRVVKAQQWLKVPRLAAIPRRRMSRIETAQFHRSRRTTRMHSVVAFNDRQRLSMDDQSVIALCEAPTMRFHEFVWETIGHLSHFESVPEQFECMDGQLVAGRFAFRHPSNPGSGIPGTSFRGIPLLPPRSVVEGASWSGDLPARGVEIRSARDVERLVLQLGLRNRRAR